MRMILTIMLLTLVGCSPFSMFQSKPEPQKVPAPPTREESQLENVKKEVGIINDLSQIADNKGITANSKESGTLLSSAKTLQTVTGLPTEPVDWRNEKEVNKLHEQLLKQEYDFRELRTEWEHEIKKLSETNSYLQKENGFIKGILEKFKFWLIVSCIALAALCFFAPTIGLPLVMFLIKRVKKAGEVAVVETANGLKQQMGQVVNAIEEYKNKQPENASGLLLELHKKTDTSTRKLIKELKN